MEEKPSFELKNNSRSLSYTPEFKKWISENPNVMALITTEIKRLLAAHPFQHGNYNLHRIAPHLEIQDGISLDFLSMTEIAAHFKVTVNDKSFFVKVQNMKDDGVRYGGTKEFAASEEARARLKGLDWVEVLPYQAAYDYTGTAGEQNKYTVSDWLPYKSVRYYLNNRHMSGTERDDLFNKFKELEKILNNFTDVSEHNAFFDPVRQKIVLYDLNKRSQ